VAACSQCTNVSQGLGQIHFSGAQDMVKWQPVVSTVILHGALDRFFCLVLRIWSSDRLL
jgi:hypothetical protein